MEGGGEALGWSGGQTFPEIHSYAFLNPPASPPHLPAFLPQAEDQAWKIFKRNMRKDNKKMLSNLLSFMSCGGGFKFNLGFHVRSKLLFIYFNITSRGF